MNIILISLIWLKSPAVFSVVVFVWRPFMCFSAVTERGACIITLTSRSTPAGELWEQLICTLLYLRLIIVNTEHVPERRTFSFQLRFIPSIMWDFFKDLNLRKAINHQWPREYQTQTLILSLYESAFITLDLPFVLWNERFHAIRSLTFIFILFICFLYGLFCKCAYRSWRRFMMEQKSWWWWSSSSSCRSETVTAVSYRWMCLLNDDVWMVTWRMDGHICSRCTV